ncbi:MAG: hypothetical protein AB1805_09230 [Nitrospirota bacterium]
MKRDRSCAVLLLYLTLAFIIAPLTSSFAGTTRYYYDELNRLKKEESGSAISYTITAIAGSNGAISPAGTVSVPSGGSQTFTITPDAGYAVTNVLVDGRSVGTPSSYSFSNVIDNRTIEAQFGPVTTEIIVDNAPAGQSSSSISFTGLWAVSGGTSPYGVDSLYTREAATYTWHAALPQTGTYEVYMWWTAYSSRTSSAPVTIEYSGGSQTINVNQQINGGRWNKLGTFSFTAAAGGKVTIISPAPSSYSYCADAVRFVYVGAPANVAPSAVIDSITPNPASVGQPVSFSGHGTDSDGTIAGYSWISSIDGQLSTAASFSSSSLSAGTHTIYFKVQDNAGAWSTEVSQTLTVNQSTDQIIIDNGGAGTSYTGIWNVSGAVNPYGADSLWSRNGATYTWRAALPQTGTYEVYMWWTEYSSRSTNAPVAVTYSGGTQTITVNQQTNGGKWNYLGTFTFDATSGGTVKLTAPDPEPTSYCADAVKFAYVPSIEVIVDNGGPGTSYTGPWAVSGGANPYGVDSLYTRETGSYTWHAALPRTGNYEVYMWWTEYTSRTSSAPVTIEYSGGSQTINVNQQINGGKWNYLGKFAFDTTAGGKVTIISPAPSSYSYCADAVRFVYAP